MSMERSGALSKHLAIRGRLHRTLTLEPQTFDIVLLVQGSATVPCLEKVELTKDRTWNQIEKLMGGDFFRYFIWFNLCAGACVGDQPPLQCGPKAGSRMATRALCREKLTVTHEVCCFES